MQLPSVDRQPGVRPAGADLASANAARVVPVPPVNPPAPVEAPGVVNAIGDSPPPVKVVYTSVSDPAQRGSEAATGPKDWTIKRPEPEKVEHPPPEPISKLLMEFLKSMWRASGSAIEVSQLQNQNVQLNQHNPQATPGVVARENLTYTPGKVRKNENI